MALNFPNAPNINDVFDDGNKTWVYTGTTWKQKFPLPPTIDGYDESQVYIVANSSLQLSLTNIAVNNGFAYVPRASNVISKFHAGNLVFSSNFTGTGYVTNAILINNDYIYTGGGNTTVSNIRKFHENNTVLNISSEAFGNTVRALAVNNGYLYGVGSGVTVNTSVIKKYHEGNLVFDSNSAIYTVTPSTHLSRIAINNGVVYVSNGIVSSFYENNLVFIGNSPSIGGVAQSLAINNGFVYASYSGGVRKYYEGNLALVGSIGLSYDAIYFEIANGFLQVFGIDIEKTYIYKYYESNLALLKQQNYIVESALSSTFKHNNRIYTASTTSAGTEYIYSFTTNAPYTNINNTPYYLVPKED